jgi:hypothetical protein
MDKVWMKWFLGRPSLFFEGGRTRGMGRHTIFSVASAHHLAQSHTLFIDEVGQTVYLTGGPNLTPSAFLNLCHMPHPHMLRAQLHRRASAACVTTRSGSTLHTSAWSGGVVWPASLQY